jgi:hypothetical protein
MVDLWFALIEDGCCGSDSISWVQLMLCENGEFTV